MDIIFKIEGVIGLIMIIISIALIFFTGYWIGRKLSSLHFNTKTDLIIEKKVPNKPIFEGDFSKFNHYIGPRLKNIIPPLTRVYKIKVGKCEHCNNKDIELDAAHRHGYERKTIIKDILSSYKINDKSYKVDLDTFEKIYKERHTNLPNIFLILCKTCHHKYDNLHTKEKLDYTPSLNTTPKDSNVTTGVLEKEDNTEQKEKIKIGIYAQDLFKDLLLNNKLSNSEINLLQDKSYCSKTFKSSGFEVLRKSSLTSSDKSGRSRYYSKEISPGYKLSSQWYDKQFNYLTSWEKRIKGKSH